MSFELILIVLVMAVAAGLWIIFTSPGMRTQQKLFVVRYEMNNGLHCEIFLFRNEKDTKTEVSLLKETRTQEINSLGISDARIVVLFVS